MAATLHRNLRANVDRIFRRLKRLGITQVRLATELGVDKSQLNHLKSGSFRPSLEWLEGFLDAVNRVLAPFKESVEPMDLFRDPNGRDDAIRDLIEELARRAGYEIVKRTKT